jgi:hypothetical protein
MQRRSKSRQRTASWHQKIYHLNDAIKGMSEEMSLTADTLTELSRYRSIEEVAPRIDHGFSIYRGPFGGTSTTI